MKLTKVEADSMQEALRKIRSTLGDDAMIVGTRTLRRGGVLGVGGKEVVEVYVTDNRNRVRNVEAEAARRRLASATAEAEPSPSPLRPLPAGPREAAREEGSERSRGPGEMEHLSRALGDLRREIRELVREKEEIPDHPFLRDAYQLLLEREVASGLASRLVGELKGLPLPVGLPDAARVRQVVKGQVRKLFLPSAPVPSAAAPRVVVLVGPTGVGKTTTIAKLAARARLMGGQRVALVTLDTFRIAAVDQLQKYAQIIGVPLGVASDPVEFRSLIGTFSREGVEALFVDTAGRSQRDEVKMTELKEFLSVLPQAEVHLVLSTTTQPRTLRSIAERFAPFGFHRVILTKLDETTAFGSLLEALVEIGKPISFLTDGQNVPDDILASDPDRLSDLVLRQVGA